MDQLYELYKNNAKLSDKLKLMKNESLEQLHAILYKSPHQATTAEVAEVSNANSPRPKSKRAKRLPSLRESENEGGTSSRGPSLRNSKPAAELVVKEEKKSLPMLAAAAEEVAEEVPEQAPPSRKSVDETMLMPPPTVPAQDANEGRPKRLAKLKSEKNLKEPRLNQKLRRPSNFDASLSASLSVTRSKSSLASNKSEESVVVVPGKTPSVVDLVEFEETESRNVESFGIRQLAVKVKREKISLARSESAETVEQTETELTVAATVPMPKEVLKTERTSGKPAPAPDTTTISTSSSNTTTTSKRNRKKKEVVKPIKVERFSDIDKLEPPISSRTRRGSNSQQKEDEQTYAAEKQTEKEKEQRAGSIYEDAIDVLPDNAKTGQQTATEINDKTVNITPNGAPCNETFQVATNQEATFTMPNANATITLPSKNADTTYNLPAADSTFNVPPPQNNFSSDATFNLPPQSKDDAQASFLTAKQSLETAKTVSQPLNDSLITEDESFEKPLVQKKILPAPKPAANTKLKSSAKAYKMPTRTNELFDPLIQSPVKMKVKAFESAVNNNSDSARSKRGKENPTTNGQSNTPLIGKLFAPTVSRFLTPTQASNITPNAMANVKKAPNSASKVIGFPKATASTSAAGKSKPLVRENSAEDFRKGLHHLAEERKKQREQKHLLAAQQREAKERERAERMAKLAKEREEKRMKKQQEAEQKRRECEEIQRKLRQNEENAAAEAAKMRVAKAKADQERLMLQHMQQTGNMKTMLPPPPKMQTKYSFEMLHTDDSSDEEGKVTYKRPPPPTWSRSNVRGPVIRIQQHWPTEIIDNFFSVQPMTADLRVIFPNIDSHQLRRNSSVLWSTPPRYSELPKY